MASKNKGRKNLKKQSLRSKGRFQSYWTSKSNERKMFEHLKKQGKL